jgi:polysaccharide export outer membrane protein
MRSIKSGFGGGVWLLVVSLWLLSGCAGSSGVTGGIPKAPEVDEYLIGVPDLLMLTVWGQEDLSGQVLVRRDGKISVPLVGDMQAAGKTPEQLSRDVEGAIKRYVSDPRVDVSVVEMRSQVVSVIGGGIRRAGVVELHSNMRVVDAIAEMGGLTPFADKGGIRVVRGEKSYSFDYAAFISGESPESNFLLAPGDTIIVPE